MTAQVRILVDFSAVLVPATLLDTEVARFTAQGEQHGN